MIVRNGEKHKSLLLKLVFILGFVFLAAMAAVIYRETDKKRQIQEEITQLQKEAEAISRENYAIRDKIAYLESKDYQEKEAKEKLSLRSPGENVVIVKPGVAKEETVQENVQAQVLPAEEKEANFLKWWNYFFKY